MDGFILTLSCPDRVGIVHAVSGFLSSAAATSSTASSSAIRDTGRFFMRVHFEGTDATARPRALRDAFAASAKQFAMDWQHRTSGSAAPRVVIMVSQHGHCLNDLLFRWRIGELPGDIPAIVSNHRDFEELAASYGIPFHHLPVTPGDARPTQEQRLLAIVAEHGVELVVLARYMQILSAHAVRAARRAHHQHPPLVPAELQGRQAVSPGARPRREADRRDRALRDGRSRRRPDHRAGRRARRSRDDAEDLTAIGRDVECVVLARAVRWHVEHRVLLNGHKTIVFR